MLVSRTILMERFSTKELRLAVVALCGWRLIDAMGLTDQQLRQLAVVIGGKEHWGEA